jgi:hypothetical protein
MNRRMTLVGALIITVAIIYGPVCFAQGKEVQGKEGGGEIQVPTARVGIISKAPSPGFCQDGATHVIHSVEGDTRLRGNNPDVNKALEKFEGKKTRVVVMGYLSWGPECLSMRVYFVGIASEVFKK